MTHDITFLFQGRRKTIAEFLSGQGPVLVSTDVASRGLDTQVVRLLAPSNY